MMGTNADLRAATETFDRRYDAESYEPRFFQRWNAPNDTNGNPRRCAVIFDRNALVLDVVDEGYAGFPIWVKQLHELPPVACKPGEYKHWLKHAAAHA